MLENLRTATGLASPAWLSLSLLDSDTTDDTGAAEFSRLIAIDPASAAWVLKFANARLMGRGAVVTTVRDAVQRLGLRASRVVVLSLMLVASQEKRLQGAGASLGGVWTRAAARGIAARALAEAASPRRSEDAFQAGVLAEVSRIALWNTDPRAALTLAEADARGAAASLEAERTIFGGSSFAASADLLRWWRVPKRIWSAVQGLDADVEKRPADARGDATSESIALVGVLRAADRLAASLTGLSETFDTRHAVSLLAASEEEIARAVAAAASGWSEHLARVGTVDDESAVVSIERRVGAALAELSLATQFENRMMKRRQDELMRRVTTDGLTGVKNRLAFDERLGDELERSQRSGKPLTLLLCDLDNFKQFNDKHGHQAGDLMLRAAAEALFNGARRIDLVARYGGEEFAVIAPQCGHEGAVTIAERLRRAVRDTTIEWRGKPLSLTTSIGAAVVSGGGAVRSASEFIDAADGLLYAAKRAGKDRAMVEPLVTVNTDPATGTRIAE